MKLPTTLAALTVTLLAVVGPAQGESATAGAALAGYAPPAAAREAALERDFRAAVSADRIRESMRHLSARPHHVGSPYDKANAEWLLARFREWGFDAHIETFDVLFPTPKARLLELVGPQRFRASLREAPLAVDPTSGQSAEQLPTYNAYSADGDVTARLVYVNYGTREDYEQLDRLGITVKGAIVIARYGSDWRGDKPKIAAEHGAVGCIIYSDPRDDGYAAGGVYPAGGWRPRTSVQRGSVMATDYPGDPLTPGVGAVPGAKRLPLAEAKTITKIPVLPISYGDAEPLLAALAGPVVPEAWRGGLPLTYRTGPGPALVHLKVLSNWDIKPVYDVIATLKGSDAADEWVLRGNHHDAWVNGAEDPLSGLTAMLEEARVLGALHAAGWQPRRTIIYCAWDGEEPGLLGSVEWVETHLAELRAHAVAYINSDDSGRGFFAGGGTQELAAVLNSAAREVEDPEAGISVFERARLYAIAQAKTADERAEVRAHEDLVLEALGDGSDFTAFQDYAGLPTLDLGFGGEAEGTQYHSIYDDFYWYTHFADTDFAYGRVLAQLGGSVMLRLADADLLPFDYGPQAEAIAKYEQQLEQMLEEKQAEYRERELEREEGVYAAIVDPRHPTNAPPAAVVPPYLSFAPMKNAIGAFHASADHYARAAAGAANSLPPASALRAVNADLLAVSRALLDERGLPGRPWFKNQIYAPSAYSGYAFQPVAAVSELMETEHWKEAEAQVPTVAAAIERAAAAVERAARDLEAAGAARTP